MRERRRVYVTGIGLVSPHGDEPDAVFDSLMQGRSAITLWDRDDVPPVAVARARFTPDRWFNKLQLSGVDRVSQMAVAAGELAREHAQLSAEVDPDRIGVYVGSGMGGARRAVASDAHSGAFGAASRLSSAGFHEHQTPGWTSSPTSQLDKAVRGARTG